MNTTRATRSPLAHDAIGATPSTSDPRTDLRSMLRGMSYADGAAALSPRSGAVQLKAADPAGAGVQLAASKGISGGGQKMPHLDRIQSAFGAHDVGSISAHLGGSAQASCDAMGAEAYATGPHVAFRAHPDLHTAAHEAAHVVQQRAGVSLQGGVGKVGDAYERHADQVADCVVAGRSAESLLGPTPGGGAEASVQLKPKKEELGCGLPEAEEEKLSCTPYDGPVCSSSNLIPKPAALPSLMSVADAAFGKKGTAASPPNAEEAGKKHADHGPLPLISKGVEIADNTLTGAEVMTNGGKTMKALASHTGGGWLGTAGKALAPLSAVMGGIEIAEGAHEFKQPGKQADGAFKVTKGAVGVGGAAATMAGLPAAPVIAAGGVGLSLGKHGDEAAKEFGVFKDKQGKAQSVSDRMGDRAWDAHNWMEAKVGHGQVGNVAGHVAAGVTGLFMLPAAGVVAVGSAGARLGKSALDLIWKKKKSNAE